MRLHVYLDKGASLGAQAPCLTMDDRVQSYGAVVAFTHRVARALVRDGVRPGEKVAILSANHADSFACVFGLSRAGAVWCPVNPRNGAAENRDTLDAFDCVALLYQSKFQPLVDELRPQLPKVRVWVCLEQLDAWLDGCDAAPLTVEPVDDVAMIVGTGGTTGRPKGVQLTTRNLETMTAIVLMSYPFRGRPVYLALPPLTHAAGVLCFPVLAKGGEIVVMPTADLAQFLRLVESARVTHTFLPPTLIYMLLEQPTLSQTQLGSLQCFWYGAAPMSVARLEDALRAFGPVMAQLFGQSEAPMMVSTMAPADHFDGDGKVARGRLASAGRPSPLCTVAIMDDDGRLLPTGERGEIVVRGSLVMAGYYKDAAATAEAGRFGWHHTGDVGYLDEENFLFIVDRKKDMIISGGFNVYSAEVEQALLGHEAVLDCGVFGLPDEKWGERVVAVVQLRAGAAAEGVTAEGLKAFVKGRLGGVKAPKQVEIWEELPRSKVGKVLKREMRERLLGEAKRGGGERH